MPSTRNAVVKQLQGIAFAAKADSNHWVIMDGANLSGGSDAGATPSEFLLFALGGCMANSVVPLLKKKRVPFSDLEVLITATVGDEPPRVFTEIHLEFLVHGTGINAVEVKRAIELSAARYCPVSAMLQKSVHITHSYRIEDAPGVKSH